MDTVASLEAAVNKVISEDKIDIIIHSMAVSDYKVKTVASASMLTKSLKDRDNAKNKRKTEPEEDSVMSLFQDTGTILSTDGKIPSNIKNV